MSNNLKISVEKSRNDNSLKPNFKHIKFEGKSINYVIINTLRRIILNHIPIYAFDYKNINISENTSVYNYGAGKTGLDYAVKKITEVYTEFNHKENENFVYVITIPHSFRRMHFEDNGVGRRCWDKPTAAEVNEYNHYLYFLHHYEILNRLIGRDKIIWGTWDDEIPKNMLDVFFDLHDNAGRHPGPESHKLYAEQIKTIVGKNELYNEKEN